MNYNEREILVKITEKLQQRPICVLFEKTGKDLAIGKGKSVFQFEPSGITFDKIKQNLKLNMYKRRIDWSEDIFKIIKPNFEIDQDSVTGPDLIKSMMQEAKNIFEKECRYFGNISSSHWAKTLVAEKDKLSTIITKTQIVKKPKVPLLTAKQINEMATALPALPKHEVNKIYKIISDETGKSYDKSCDNVIDLATLKTTTLISIRSIIKKWYKKNNKPYPSQ